MRQHPLGLHQELVHRRCARLFRRCLCLERLPHLVEPPRQHPHLVRRRHRRARTQIAVADRLGGPDHIGQVPGQKPRDQPPQEESRCDPSCRADRQNTPRCRCRRRPLLIHVLSDRFDRGEQLVQRGNRRLHFGPGLLDRIGTRLGLQRLHFLLRRRGPGAFQGLKRHLGHRNVRRIGVPKRLQILRLIAARSRDPQHRCRISCQRLLDRLGNLRIAGHHLVEVRFGGGIQGQKIVGPGPVQVVGHRGQVRGGHGVILVHHPQAFSKRGQAIRRDSPQHPHEHTHQGKAQHQLPPRCEIAEPSHHPSSLSCLPIIRGTRRNRKFRVLSFEYLELSPISTFLSASNSEPRTQNFFACPVYPVYPTYPARPAIRPRSSQLSVSRFRSTTGRYSAAPRVCRRTWRCRLRNPHRLWFRTPAGPGYPFG